MIFRRELVEKILAGEKTETRRKVKPGETECRYKVGKTYAAQPGRGMKGVARIRIEYVRREELGDMRYGDAEREGFDGVGEFLAYWEKLYGAMDLTQEVWVIGFKKRGQVALHTLGAGAL